MQLCLCLLHRSLLPMCLGQWPLLLLPLMKPLPSTWALPPQLLCVLLPVLLPLLPLWLPQLLLP
jgi:hypothetical protein